MIKSAEIKKVLYQVADRFGYQARQTIICQCEGKHFLEIGLILRRVKEGIRILDVGGGMGINLLCLNELTKAYQLYLVDRFSEYDKNNLVGPAQIGLDIMKAAKINVACQDFWNVPLPYESNYFDLVTCFDVLEHLPSHPLGLLGEIRRVLKSEGSVIISGPNAVSLQNRTKLMLGRHPYIDFECWCRDKYYSHYREYNRNEYYRLFEKSGFEEIKIFMSTEPTRSYFKKAYFHRKLKVISPCDLGLWFMLGIKYFCETAFPNLRPSIYCTAKISK